MADGAKTNAEFRATSNARSDALVRLWCLSQGHGAQRGWGRGNHWTPPRAQQGRRRPTSWSDGGEDALRRSRRPALDGQAGGATLTEQEGATKAMVRPRA